MNDRSLVRIEKSAVADADSHVRKVAREQLAAQPPSLVGLSQVARDLIVVTAVSDETGVEHVVSRMGDKVWHMASELVAKNVVQNFRSVRWPENVPQALLDDAKAAIYCALRYGRHGRLWSGSSALRTAQESIPLLRHLGSMGISSFGELRALHLSDHIRELRQKVLPTSAKNRLTVIDLVWSFRSQMISPLLQHPWGGLALHEACGCLDDGDAASSRTAKTPVIPPSVQRTLFSHCEVLLADAEARLMRRDAELIASMSYEITAIRDAALYLIQITSGMRNSESTGITLGCWRTETINGVTFHWVRTREIKTKRGEVEFLVPPEALQTLEVLARCVKPLHLRLADEERWLVAQLRSSHNGRLENGMAIADGVGRLNHIRGIRSHLFLCINTGGNDHLGTGSRVDVMSSGACVAQLRALAKSAGTDWNLANHQCRRTFSYNAVNSRMGRMGLVFVKWQLKHASMSWSQLYAANPRQDQALYQEMQDEQREARAELMEGWMRSDVPLSGGAGVKLLQNRATPVRNLKELIQLTAEVTEVRSTGHAWCLSGTQGCGGHGVYDPSLCAPCSQAIIDSAFATTWQMIHLDNLRLAAITDCGPGVVQKAGRAVQASAQVLKDLRVAEPDLRQVEAYESELAAS